jgi:hypothetical protein
MQYLHQKCFKLLTKNDLIINNSMNYCEKVWLKRTNIWECSVLREQSNIFFPHISDNRHRFRKIIFLYRIRVMKYNEYSYSKLTWKFFTGIEMLRNDVAICQISDYFVLLFLMNRSIHTSTILECFIILHASTYKSSIDSKPVCAIG